MRRTLEEVMSQTGFPLFMARLWIVFDLQTDLSMAIVRYMVSQKALTWNFGTEDLATR